uniref:NADH-ubiquinone oxidoreductase chain 4 n=1 Tax=Balanoglossus clavigerus TaxID=560604 RepID=D3H5X0_BALCL|nr:NADH dehydrogenase subunit 4 [Balanoglossus clavigerus]CBH40144.1 NADH dehydrogenase subunit 4 [Balanoglossus clavigerus]
MTTITLFALAILISALITPQRFLWPNLMAQSSILSLLSLTLLTNHHSTSWHNLTFATATDSLSTPLIILSIWLLPLSLLASRRHLQQEPQPRQRIYSALLCSLTLILIITFSALDLLLFYVAFEATLIPTLIIITRWGYQPERLQAGTYFLFYTLFASLPLLIALLTLYNSLASISIPLTILSAQLTQFSINSLSLWCVASIIAFLAKLPIYGTHLWLPKAHVEAPIAGSMILAAILLKLGGYGLIRFTEIFSYPTNTSTTPLMILCVWGALVTSLICIRQTDMKALIAYSSVGHMSLVAAGVFSQTCWGIHGSIILMIAHGLVSSALFCLANLSYERTHTRTLALNRGLKLLMPLSTTWWLITAAANLGLPPLPNLFGELFIINALLSWSPITLLTTGLMVVFSAVYTLYLLQSSQHSSQPQYLKKVHPSFSLEHLNMSLHLTPLILLTLKPELICLQWPV